MATALHTSDAPVTRTSDGLTDRVTRVMSRVPRPRPTLAFGEPQPTSADPGLFGPESVSWRVHSDVIAGIGGIRAILLQGLHPEAMAGIVAHSDYRDDPWGRLFRTAEYIGVITFGTTSETERAAAKVRGIHRRLQLDEPEWLLWVHAGFTDSLLTTARRAGLSLTDAEADAYVREQVVAAELVGLRAGDVPSTTSELADYIESMRPTLRVDATARDTAKFVLIPPMPAKTQLLTPARPAWTAFAFTAFGLLPQWARAMYGAPMSSLPVVGSTLADTQATVAARALRHGLNALPESVRTGPHLAAARERLSL